MSVLDKRRMDHIVDDCLFDLNLLSKICYGLDDIESLENNARNNKKSSDTFKKSSMKIRSTLDHPEQSPPTGSQTLFFETDLHQMWSELNDAETNSNDKIKAKKINDMIRFPELLMMILDQNEHSSITSWQNDGKSFSINDQSEFQNTILPLYFVVIRICFYWVRCSVGNRNGDE